MGYLEDFIAQINQRDFNKFLQLWEEYCASDDLDYEEFQELLIAIKKSDFAQAFGKIVETALPLLELIEVEEEKFSILKHLIDLQSTNTPKLAEITLQYLEKKYKDTPLFSDRLRMVGLRSKENFQGALSNFELLAHMGKGKFVFHEGGWGVGEIMELSTIREQIAVEFENVSGLKHITFTNAFKTLIPIPADNFLARRFSDADNFEKQAKEDPVSVIKLLLRDLGPKTAAEIKDEMSGLIIPEKEWSKWWQNTRSKLKKDTLIETPEALKDPFRLRKTAVSHAQKFSKDVGKQTGVEEILQTSYSFLRDNAKSAKDEAMKAQLNQKMHELLQHPDLTNPQKLSIYLYLEDLAGTKQFQEKIKDFIINDRNIEKTIDQIQIIAYKKKALVYIRGERSDWIEIFLNLLFTPQLSLLRDYLLKELNEGHSRSQLELKLKELSNHPLSNPETLVWYFTKLTSKDASKLPFGQKEGVLHFFEAFLILYSLIENKPEMKDLTKKMYLMISNKRYALVRSLIADTSLEFLNEFLLLSAKCQTFTDADQKILRSLAEVVQPSLSTAKSQRSTSHIDAQTIWALEKSLIRMQEKAKHIGTVEIVENAREIEAARALGDLRENSEFKFALEKRSRLQAELKTLSDQISHARILTKDDIHPNEVGIGSVVTVVDSKGSTSEYTLLGPWDADPDKGILSLQSKFAQTMAGSRVGDSFTFRDEKYTISNLKSYFD